MTGLITVSLLAFTLGLRHATDADHVVAVSTFVTRHRTMGGAVRIGAVWGLGHTATILLVGGGIILLGWAIPPRLEMTMELVVGLMLILLGAANLGVPIGARWLRRPRAAALEAERALGGFPPYALARPLVVGVVHGLAGSAAVVLLVLAAIPGPMWSLTYLLAFGLGTIVGMTMMTTAIGLPLLHPRLGVGALPRRLRLTAGALSVALGLFIVCRTGLAVGGLWLPPGH